MGKYSDYYCNDYNKRLKPIVDHIITKNFGWLPQKEYDDFYSIAGQAVWYCEEHYDENKGKTFELYLIDSLHRKFKTRITHNNRKKRNNGTVDVSISKLIDEESNITIGDMLIQKEEDGIDILVDRYLELLTKKQRQVAKLMMEGYTDKDIKAELRISSEQYKVIVMNMKKDEKITPLKTLKERMKYK